MTDIVYTKYIAFELNWMYTHIYMNSYPISIPSYRFLMSLEKTKELTIQGLHAYIIIFC